ncbi:unnamed protein product [Arabidopsis thaliana]|uniref:Uncharacterized protein n=1 Tax=Arabidopsis thaliana TaxID=3702 RepID=A0A5S9XH93_ARATH|nr:unnamed protein product [Arabidopsis thaliana]VYS59150.1 unnamed protein product [Arabidopsis thaliana]
MLLHRLEQMGGSVCRDLHLQDLTDMKLWSLYKPRLIKSPVIMDMRPPPPRPCGQLQRPPPPRPYGYRTFTKFLR